MDILLQEIEPVVMEKNEFEFRDFSKLLTFCYSPTINVPTPGTKSKNFKSSCPRQTTRIKIENLQQEFTSVVIENKELEHRQMSEVLAVFWQV